MRLLAAIVLLILSIRPALAEVPRVSAEIQSRNSSYTLRVNGYPVLTESAGESHTQNLLLNNYLVRGTNEIAVVWSDNQNDATPNRDSLFNVKVLRAAETRPLVDSSVTLTGQKKTEALQGAMTTVIRFHLDEFPIESLPWKSEKAASSLAEISDEDRKSINDFASAFVNTLQGKDAKTLDSVYAWTDRHASESLGVPLQTIVTARNRFFDRIFGDATAQFRAPRPDAFVIKRVGSSRLFRVSGPDGEPLVVVTGKAVIFKASIMVATDGDHWVLVGTD